MFETWTARSSWTGPFARKLGPEGRAGVLPDREEGTAAPGLNARMSARTMRPPGPEPVTREASMPFSAASFFASGEILMRPLLAGAAALSPRFSDGRGEGAASPLGGAFTG